jgi:hypothetical protein
VPHQARAQRNQNFFYFVNSDGLVLVSLFNEALSLSLNALPLQGKR